jgi:hypothetical protein
MGDTRTGRVVESNLYKYLLENCDPDGFITTSGAAIASHFRQPSRTIQYALRRLENQGKICCIGYRRFAIVEKATLDDEV